MKLDKDIKMMTDGEARQELQRVRELVRTHRDREGNSRCWHADLELYGRVLPENEMPGRMDLPKDVLLANCSRYIDRQQCDGSKCSLKP